MLIVDTDRAARCNTILIRISQNLVHITYGRGQALLYIKSLVVQFVHISYIHTYINMKRSPPSRWSGLHHTNLFYGVTYSSIPLVLAATVNVNL